MSSPWRERADVAAEAASRRRAREVVEEPEQPEADGGERGRGDRAADRRSVVRPQHDQAVGQRADQHGEDDDEAGGDGDAPVPEVLPLEDRRAEGRPQERPQPERQAEGEHEGDERAHRRPLPAARAIRSLGSLIDSAPGRWAALARSSVRLARRAGLGAEEEPGDPGQDDAEHHRRDRHPGVVEGEPEDPDDQRAEQAGPHARHPPLEAVQVAGPPQQQERHEGQADRDQPGPHARREDRQVGLDLAADRHPGLPVDELLREPAEVGALVGRTGQVEGGQGRDGDHRAGPDGQQLGHADPPAGEEDDDDGEGRDGGQHAADVRAEAPGSRPR